MSLSLNFHERKVSKMEGKTRKKFHRDKKNNEYI